MHIKEFYYETQKVLKIVPSKEKWARKKPESMDKWGKIGLNEFTIYDHTNNLEEEYPLTSEGSTIVYLLSTLENYCMMIIYDYFLDENIIPAALIFDGMIIYKERQGEIINETYLKEKLRLISDLINIKFHEVTGKKDINLNIMIELKELKECINLELNK